MLVDPLRPRRLGLRLRSGIAALGPAAVPLALLATLASCGDRSGSGQTLHLEIADAERCEVLDPEHCLLPFPSDALTVTDPSTDTGRRIAFARESLPANVAGVHVDPTEWWAPPTTACSSRAASTSTSSTRSSQPATPTSSIARWASP